MSDGIEKGIYPHDDEEWCVKHSIHDWRWANRAYTHVICGNCLAKYEYGIWTVLYQLTSGRSDELCPTRVKQWLNKETVT